MYPKKYIKRCAIFGGCSIFLLISGILIISLRTLIYKSVINKIFLLQYGSYTYDVWKKSPIPVQLKLYLFNWTNAAEVHNSSVKPFFQELGPYTFDETKEKVNITWNENNNTVSFYHLKRWSFNVEESGRNLNDALTSVNPVALSSAVTAKNWHLIIKLGLNGIHRSVGASIYSTHLAGEILFAGYEDPLLTMANNMPSFASLSLPDLDKFGWFYTRNGSEKYEGHFNMDMGITGQLGDLYSWKFMQQTPYFPGACGKVKGSAGEFFPNNLQKDTLITFFSPDLCRYVELEFEKEVVIKGILGYKYVAGDRFLDNGTKIPENKCFCNGDCMPSGALDISTCRYGTPAFVSLPNFYKADPHYTRVIDGMNPNEDDHDFFMIFEPKTGLPLHVSARIQLNLHLQPIHGIRLLQNVPNIYVPVLWFEQSVLIPDDMVFYLIILTNFEVICLVLGIIMIFLSVILEVCYCYKVCTTNLLERQQALTITREKIPLTNKKSNYGFE